MTPIFIPTFGREKVRTIDCLSEELRDRVVLVVVSEEEGKRLGRRYLVSKEQGKGVHRVRHWIVEYCRRVGISCCIMLDDDVKLTTAYWEEGKKRFHKPGERELDAYFLTTEFKALEEGVGFTSFSQTYFNTYPEEWSRNKDNAGTYFVNVSAVGHSGATFLLPSVDDRSFILGTIEAGLEVWANTYVGVTKVGKHGRGGEALVEDRGKRHEESLRVLAARYPRFVRLRRTKSDAYRENYGTDLSAVFYLDRMWKAKKKGEDVRASSPLEATRTERPLQRGDSCLALP